MRKNTISDNIKRNLQKLSLNVKNSKLLLFYMPGRNVIIPNLYINSIKLECLDSLNFLGITIDKHLTWKEHIHLFANKIYRIVCVINRSKHYIPQNVILPIYNTLIIPHLNHRILTWGFNANRILKIKKKTVRSITLKGQSQAKIIKKSVILFRLLNMTMMQTCP